MSDSDRGKLIPVVSPDHYKVILRPATEFDRTRRNLAHPGQGISYTYGITVVGVGGESSEIIEVWFDRSKNSWTASSVIRWMESHRDGLPTPTKSRAAPAGRPHSAGGK